MKIFLGLTEVSGYYSHLKKGFDELGVYAVHVPLQAHRFRYDEEVPSHFFVKWARYCVTKRVSLQNPNAVQKLFWFASVALTRLVLFVWAVFTFDVFILGGGSSFFSFRELPLLRLLGKKVIYTFFGTDARPAYLDGFFTPDQIGFKWPLPRAADRPSAGNDEARRRIMAEAQLAATLKRKAGVRAAERYANAVICGPSFAQFMTRDFINFFIIGIPLNIDTPACAEIRAAARRPRILHAPSQNEGKGTALIRRAIANLEQKGIDVEYVEISDRPNEEVIGEIRRCDFVIDQVYSDTPIAGFATEAAFHGKPAIVGSYYSDLIKEQMVEELIPPSLFCHPDALERSIETLASDINFRRELGERAAVFVRNKWRAKEVAARYLRLIRGDIPEVWKFSAQRVSYVHGVGLSEDRMKSHVQSLISLHGVKSLQLADKPELEQRLVALACQESARNAH